MVFKTLVRTPENGVNYILGCLLETWRKLWPMLNKVAVPELSWQIVKERINELGEMGVLK